MDQEIRFCDVGGRRVAYATIGSGPPLVLPAPWISHLELEWELDEVRAFLGELARDRTVVRYDRLGTGLSDRGTDGSAVEDEVATLAAVADALGLRSLSLLGISWGGCVAAAFAAREPERVRAVAVFGGFARGAGAAPPELREAMLATVRAHWGAGSRMLADVWLGGCEDRIREDFARLQRAAADAETAAAMLAAVYDSDIRDSLTAARAPALVLHRRDDRAIPFELGRELASLMPNARLLALDGAMHPPWLGDTAPVLAALREFLASADPVPAAEAPLSGREVEVLRLVADGLSDAEIAERLIVSPHTVHRHVANIRLKLGQPSRAAAAARATRDGLI